MCKSCSLRKHKRSALLGRGFKSTITQSSTRGPCTPLNSRHLDIRRGRRTGDQRDGLQRCASSAVNPSGTVSTILDCLDNAKMIVRKQGKGTAAAAGAVAQGQGSCCGDRDRASRQHSITAFNFGIRERLVITGTSDCLEATNSDRHRKIREFSASFEIEGSLRSWPRLPLMGMNTRLLRSPAIVR